MVEVDACGVAHLPVPEHVRTYEPFKTEAKRLTSITCDRCDAQLYTVARQVGGRLDYHGSINSDKLVVWTHGGYDLCADCLQGARHTLIAYIGKEATR